MNRFDSAFSSQQPRFGRWFQALLLTVITTAGLLTGISVKAQTVTLGMSPVPPNNNPVCAGSPTTLRATLNTAGINIGYALALPAYPGLVALAAPLAVVLDDDEVSAQILVPGAVFPFHGSNVDLGVNGFYIGSNGFVTFRNDPLAVQIAPRNLAGPGLGQTYDAIYVVNTDLSPQLGGQILYEYNAIAQTVTVAFQNVPFFYPNPPGVGVPNPAVVDVQLVMYCNGSANPGRIEVRVQNIDDNLVAVQAAQEQFSIGILSRCQPPVASIGVNQLNPVGAYGLIMFQWDPAAPALAGTQTQFFRCPTVNVPCNGVGGTSVGTVAGAGPNYDQSVTPPASLVNNTYYYYARTSLNNCTTIQTPNPDFAVVANAQPVAIGITGNQNVCQGSAVSYSVTPSIAGSTVVYTTTAPGAVVLATGANTADITYPAGGSNPGANYNITVVETGPAPTNCSFSNVYTNRVTIYLVPVGPLNAAPDPICAVATGTNTSTYSMPAGYNDYAWSFLANTIGATFPAGNTNTKVVTVTNQPVQPAGAATVTVQVIASNGPANMCTATFSRSITVNPIPPANSVTAAPAGAVCMNDNVVYSITGTVGLAGNTYTYTASGLPYTYTGGSAGYVNGTALAATVVANQSRQLQWTAAGVGTMTVIETTASGCTRTYSVNTTVNPLPTPSIIGSNTPCQFVASAGGNPSYQSAPTPIQYGYSLNTIVVGNSYRWSIGGGAASIIATTGSGTPSVAPGVGVLQTATPGNFDLNVSGITVQWTGTGARTVDVTERTALGCVASTSLAVTVIATPTAASFGVTGSLTPCAAPGPGNVVAYSTIGGAGTHTITISGGTITATAGGYVSGPPTQASGVGAVASAFTVTWGGAGTGTISDEYTDAGCAAVETYTVTINPNPTFSVVTTTAPLCGNGVETFSVAALVNGGAPSYAWSETSDPDNIGTPGVLTNPTVNVTFLNPPGATSAYQLTLTVTNTTTGCAATVVQNFTINQTPSAPVVGAIANACGSAVGDVRTTTYTINPTIAGATYAISLVGAPAGTTNPATVAGTGGAVNFIVTWGNLAQNAAAVQITTPVTVNVTVTTAAGCTSPTATQITSVSALPVQASLATIPPLCATSAVPVPLTITTNGGAGQPGVTYTWAAPGGGNVTLAGAGPGLANSITALNGAGAKSIIVTSNGAAPHNCNVTRTFNFVVDPVPTPVVSGPNAACQELVNPVGLPHAGPWTFTYVYSTPLVAGNSYSWQVSAAWIVAYSTNNGGTWTNVPGNVVNPNSQTLIATLNASQIRVVMYGATPAKIKVTELHPGGCGATTLDYNVNLNVIPTQYALGVTPQHICNTGTQTAPLTLANSQAGYSYQVQRSTNGGTSWANSVAAAQNGTGAALNFTVPTADLAYTTVAPAPTVYLFRVVASNIAPVCGPYVVSLANATVNVHSQPTFGNTVTITPNIVCQGDLINVTIGATQTWVNYDLQSAPIADFAGNPLAPVWGGTIVSGIGTGGNLVLTDNTFPAGGNPLLNVNNYRYRVIATSVVAPPSCQVTLTAMPEARVFALPVTQVATFTPNPACWEQDVTVNLAGSQNGVTYEILRFGASMAPPVIVQGTGANIAVVIPAYSVLLTNPVVPTPVTFDVRATLRTTGGGVYSRPVPASTCPFVFGNTVVTVNPKPVAAITGPATACGPSMQNYGAVTPSWGGWPATYNWDILTLATVPPGPNDPPTGTTPLFATNTGFGTVNPYTVNWGVHNLACNGSYNPLPVQIRMIETNAFGCPDTAIKSITIQPTIADAAISGPTIACIYGGFEEHLTTYTVARAGGCIFPVGTTFLWAMPTGPVIGVIRSGQNTPQIVAEWHATGGTNIGTINLTMTLPPSHGGCATVITYNVTVYPQPQPVITGPTSVCQNSTGSPTSTSIYSATLFAGDTYMWQVVGGNITTPGGATGAGTVLSPSTYSAVNGNSITVTWGTAANPNATITLTQTSVVGCINRTTLNVVVHPTPNPSISGPQRVCDNSAVTYTTANNAPANSYAWSITGGNATPVSGANQASYTVLAGAIGGGATFTLQLVETNNATTCSKTVTRLIDIVATPQPQITRTTPGGAVGGACLGQTVVYSNTDPVAANPTYSYQWTVSNGTVTGGTTSASVTVTWNTVGTGTLTLAKWHTGSQCTTTVSQNVAITNNPAPSITGPLFVCGNAVVVYSTPNVVGNTYAWTFTNAVAQSALNTNALTLQFNNPPAGSTLSSNVSVIETNTLSGCTGSSGITVTVRYQPLVQVIAGPVTACQYNATNNPAAVVYSVVSNPSSTYSWTATGATFTTATNIPTVAVRWTTVGTQTITAIETDASGNCSATSTLNVAVTYQPVPTVSGNTAVCTNATEVYSTPAVAGSTYSWTVTGTGADRNIVSGTTNNSLTVQWLTPGSRTVSVTETAGFCSASSSLLVTVTATPAPVISRVGGGLLNQACLGATISYQTPNLGGTTYLWTVTGGTFSTANGLSSITVNWTALGNQTLTVRETATANVGCFGIATLNVSVEEQPNPVITGNVAVCTQATHTYSVTAVAGHTYSWGVTGAGTDRMITTGTTSSSVGVQWLMAGSYTVSVTQTNNTGNCSRATSIGVTVTTTPAPVISRVGGGLLNQACLGATISYQTPNLGGTTYLWTVTGGTFSTANGLSSITVNWTALGNQTLTVRETAVANVGCFGIATLNVSVEEQPNPVIAGPTPVCSGTTQTYFVTAVPGHTYAWTVSGAPADRTIVSAINSNMVSVSWINAGVYTVSVTQTNNTGNCTRVANLSVTVQQTPTATFITRLTAPGQSRVGQACQGETIQYSTPANALSGFQWIAVGGVINGTSTTNTASVTWQTIGNNTLSVTETTTGTPCFRTVTQNVAVSYTPTPNITGSLVVCINKEHAYSTPAVAGSTYNWLITPANSFAVIAGYPAANAIVVRWIQPGLHTMSVTETALGGYCFTTTTVNIRVNPIPTPDIQSTTGHGTPTTRRPGIVCNNSTHVYTVTPTPGNVFQWVVTGGTITLGQNTSTLTVQWGPAGTGTIACTETVPGSDCITTDRDTILIRPTPTPVITGQINPCGSSVQDYTTPLVAGNVYAWTVVGGSFITIAPNTIRVTWSAPVWPNTIAGSVAVREDVADVLPPGTCFGLFTLATTIRPVPPVPVVTGPIVVCATNLSNTPPTINTAAYTSSNPGTTAGSGTLATNWVVTNGNITAGQGTFGVSVQWTNTTLAPITGTLSVTHTSSFGCAATGSLVVTINPLPTPSIAGPRSVCQNSLQNYSTPGIPGHAYSWVVSGGNIIRSGQGSPNVTVEWTLPGAATLTVTEVNTFGCTVLNTINVTVNGLPTVYITASGPTTFCQGGDVTLAAPLGFASYVWNTGETARSIVVRTTGRYWVRVTDMNGCSNSSDTIQVNVFPTNLPIIAISGPTTFCEGASVVLTGPAGFSAYYWSTGATTQSITVTQSGSYTVSVADGNGCTGTSTEIDVTVYPKPMPVLAVIGSTNVCAGDSVEVRAPAGFVSYTWTATSGNNYGTTRTIILRSTDTVYCQVVDVNGCIGISDTVGVKSQPVISPVITANGPTTFCDGGTVTLTAPAGFASYIWSNGATGRSITVASGGEYWVTVTNSATCPASSTKTPVVVNNLPAVPTISRMGDILNANSATAQAWQWFRNGTVIAGAIQRSLTIALPGSYRVEIADNNSCPSISDAFDVILTDVDEDIVAGRLPELRIFPNPTSGRFSIETSVSTAGPVRIELINTVGEVVLSLNENANGGNFRSSVDMGILAGGVYNVVVTAGNERWVVRLVRQ